jgi:hypothetical protein
MNLVSGIHIRVALLTALLISGSAFVAHSRSLPEIIPNELRAFQAVGLHSPAMSPQDSQVNTQQAPVSHDPPPVVDTGRGGSTPIVIYEHGQLTINAENVRIADIMSALHNAMGAEVDLPAGASEERIWARLGPGPARKILSDLLSNTDLNYVIQGSSRDADGIQSVMLTAHTDTAPGKEGDPGESARMADRRQPRANSGTTEAPEHEVPTSQEPAVAAEVTPPSPAAVPAETPPTPPIAADVQPPPANPFAHPGPPASLTQEQMVQQLTNMYQQRKQIQQNQTGSIPN